MDNWREWFDGAKDYSIRMTFYESTEVIKVEDLYQAFKARMMDELSIECQIVSCDSRGTIRQAEFLEFND